MPGTRCFKATSKLVFVIVSVALTLPLISEPLRAQSAGENSWKSFELVYYSPAAKPNTPSPFNVDPASEFTTEMRIDYLRRYANALVERTSNNHPKYFAFDVETAEAARERALQIKPRPMPGIRQIIPLKYWRWKMEPNLEGVPDTSWEGRKFDDELFWSAMEAPRMFAFNRAALLRTHFRGPSSQLVLLSIGSIVDAFDMWINGRHAAHHNGFEPVTLDITQFVERGADNTLAIRIENKPKDQIGIADDISVLGVSAPYLSDVFLKTDRAQDEQADATLEIEANQTAEPMKASVKVQITPWFPHERPEAVYTKVVPLDLSSSGMNKVNLGLHLSGIDLWSPDMPRLYLMRVELRDGSGNAIDDLVEVTGFRRIEQRQGQLYLNGHPWFMKSFGEDLGFGPGFDFMGNICPPDDWIVRDLELARKTNANLIRVHPWGFTGDIGNYTDAPWPVWGLPNSSTNYQSIAWIADQLGIGLIWGTRVWTLWPADFQHKFADGDDSWQARLKSSLQYVRNRPSILVYEGLNEVAPDVKTRSSLTDQYEQFCQRYLELVNSIDDSRLVTPDTPWGVSSHSSAPDQDRPYFPEKATPFHPVKLYTSVENTFWNDHNYYGWYRNLLQGPLLDKVQKRPFVLLEAGAEAMPDWTLYRGMRWQGIWLNNGRSCGAVEQARLGRPLRILENSEVNISQAYQGLSIVQTVYATRFSAADGININLIADGLAEGDYHKGVSDINRNAKLGFFAAQMAYQPLVVMGAGYDFVMGAGDQLHLQVAADSYLWGKPVQLTLEVIDDFGNVIDKKQMPFTLATNQRVTAVGSYAPRFDGKGYYLLRYNLALR